MGATWKLSRVQWWRSFSIVLTIYHTLKVCSTVWNCCATVRLLKRWTRMGSANSWGCRATAYFPLKSHTTWRWSSTEFNLPILSWIKPGCARRHYRKKRPPYVFQVGQVDEWSLCHNNQLTPSFIQQTYTVGDAWRTEVESAQWHTQQPTKYVVVSP